MAAREIYRYNVPVEHLAHLEHLDYWDTACEELSRRDSVLADLIGTHRHERLNGSGDAFRTLANAIVGQQISVAAAESVWKRLVTAGGGDAFSPETVLSLSPEELRSAGLSLRKVEYLSGAARAFAEGRTDPGRWHVMSDDEVRRDLTGLRGIGPWTAEMMLIFYLHRPDVLPLADIGLVNNASRLYGWDMKEHIRDRTATLKEHAELWRPWRTVATWYIWRDLDAEPVVY